MALIEEKKEKRRIDNRSYDKEVYYRLTIRLRKDEDDDIIDSFHRAKEYEISSRQWLRGLFESEPVE